jgi:tryptophanyl-tRNA synthetase
MVHDLTTPMGLEIQCSVISLEVGEHLPKEAQETFMNTLVNHCAEHLILSWAEIGQAGIGHINCRSQEDVINDIVSRGFEYLPNETQDARNNIDDNCNWFRRTLLIFKRCNQ